MSIQELCNEISVCILKHLKMEDIFKLGQTCKFYNNICSDDTIWKHLTSIYYRISTKIFANDSWFYNFKYLHTVKTLAQFQIVAYINRSNNTFFNDMSQMIIDTFTPELNDTVIVHIPPKNNFVGVIKRKHIYQITGNSNKFVFNSYPKTYLTDIEYHTLKSYGYLVQIHVTNPIYILYTEFDKIHTIKSYEDNTLSRKYCVPNLDGRKIIQDAITKNIKRIGDNFIYINEIIRPDIICTMIKHWILPSDIPILYETIQKYIDEYITIHDTYKKYE